MTPEDGRVKLTSTDLQVWRWVFEVMWPLEDTAGVPLGQDVHDTPILGIHFWASSVAETIDQARRYDLIMPLVYAPALAHQLDTAVQHAHEQLAMRRAARDALDHAGLADPEELIRRWEGPQQ